MRDPQVVEAELIEISAIQGDITKLERIVAWCATYPDEVPFALSFFRSRVDAVAQSSNPDGLPLNECERGQELRRQHVGVFDHVGSTPRPF
jgi:hypothetical protein